MPAIQQSTADALEATSFVRPFAKPRLVVTDFRLQSQPDAVNLADFPTAPRRSAQAEQQAVRPTITFREVGEGQLIRVSLELRHATPLRTGCPEHPPLAHISKIQLCWVGHSKS